MIKKIFVFLIAYSMCLAGCTAQEEQTEEVRFSLSKTDQEAYKQKIEETLDSMYWYYDDNTLAYYQDKVPQQDEDGMFEASENSGYNLSENSGKEAVVYTVDLYHFNNEKAGIVYFYFVRKNLVGVFYTAVSSPGKYYGLNNRNIFINDAEFAKYEDTAVNDRTFEQYPISSKLYDGFSSIYTYENEDTRFVTIQDNYIRKYTFSGTRFTASNSINIMALYGKTPVSASMLENGYTAVMIGSVVDENVDDEGNERIVAEKIIFFDKAFRKTNEEIELTGSTYSCIGTFENGFVAANDRNTDVYTLKDGKYIKTGSYYLNVQMTDFKEFDLDNDGTKEYIATDGKDLFIYRKKTGGFECIWRTNISVDSFYGYIYAGDLNGDGVKEIYLCDNTGTVIKYILTKNGLVSENEEIAYGNRIYAGDFNGDGKDDYLFVDDAQEGDIVLNLCN